jgi:hypothetical protein
MLPLTSEVDIGITSDGSRILLISNNTLWASATDLLSLDEIQFESYTYDSTLRGVTAMTWYALLYTPKKLFPHANL